MNRCAANGGKSLKAGLAAGLAAVGIGVLLLYLWVAVPDPGTWTGRTASDAYQLQTAAWLSGQTHLPGGVNPGMLALKNPYDPQENRPYRIVDFSYYRGRYYLYFGPAPIVALLLPWKLLTGTYLSTELATACLLAGASGLSLVFLVMLWRRHFIHAQGWLLFVAAILLGVGNLQLQHLTHAGMYFLPRGNAHLAAMLAFIASYWSLATSRWKKLALGLSSLAVGATLASRPTFFPVGFALLPPLWAGLRPIWKTHGNRGSTRIIASWMAAATVPAGICGLGLLWYNWIRFDDALEFGNHYQLNDAGMAGVKTFSLGYIGPNLRDYLFNSPAWVRYFPFLREGYAPPLGILLFLPFTWLALAVPFVRAEDQAGSWRIWSASFLAGTLALMGLLTAYFSSSNGYQIDFTIPLIFIACLGWLGLAAQTQGYWRGVVTAGGLILAIITLAFNVFLFGTHYPRPERIAPVARVFNIPVSWVEQLRGWRHGPLTLNLKFPLPVPGRAEPLVTTGLKGEDMLYVRYVDETHLQFGFYGTSVTALELPPHSIDYGQPHTLKVFLGAFTPPSEHPLLADWTAQQKTYARSQLRLRLDGEELFATSAYFHDSHPGVVRLGENRRLGNVAEPRFTGQILSHTQEELTLQTLPATPALATAVALEVKFRPDLAGWSEPLVHSGIPSDGDLLGVTYLADQRLQFFFRRKGADLIKSWPIPFDFNHPYTLRLRWAALSGITAPARVGRERLIVLLDEAVILDQTLPPQPAPTGPVLFGVNPTNDDTMRPMFSGLLTTVRPIAEEALVTATTLAGGTGRVALQVRFPSVAGQSLQDEPLVVTGRTGAGDLIYLHYREDGRVQFGHDHWGFSGILGEPVIVDPTRIHRLEITMDSLWPPEQSARREKSGHLEVRLDGQVVLEGPRPVYPAAIDQRYLGANPIGGSTCAERFSGELRLMAHQP